MLAEDFESEQIYEYHQKSLDELMRDILSVGNESTSHKPEKIEGQQCSCRKSKCRRHYCVCFSNGKQCGEACQCKGCENIIDDPEKIPRARQGCTCLRIKCVQNYCECFRNGNGCLLSCKCYKCKNGNIKSLKKKPRQRPKKILRYTS